MPVIITLKNAVLDRTNVAVFSFTLLIASTAIKNIERIDIAPIDIPAVKRNVLNTLFSFALYAITIDKNIKDINIKNSTITNSTNTINIATTEKFPVIIVDNNSFKVVSVVGDANIISNAATKVTKPKVISIIAVKNFEVISSFFVTGRVCVK